MAASAANVPLPPTNAPGLIAPPPPPPPYAVQGYAVQGYVPYVPAPPPGPKGPSAGPMVLGLLGGLIALLGAVIGWIQVQTCAGMMGFSMCVSVPVPPSYAIGNFDAFLGMAPLLALVFALIGMVVVLLQKPQTALVGGLMGVASMALAVVWMVRATPFFAVIQSNMGGASASVSVGPGFGLYISIFGSLMLAVGGLVQWKALKAYALKAAPTAAPAPTA